MDTRIWIQRFSLIALLAAFAIGGGVEARPRTGGTCKGKNCGGSFNFVNPAELTGTSAIDSEELKLFNLINQYRAANGVGPLVMSIKLTLAADWMATDSAKRYYVGHTDSLGRYVDTRLYEGFGIPSLAAIGENACGGSGSLANAQGCFDAWKLSPGHNWAMLYSEFKAIGIGRGTIDGGANWYWINNFSSLLETGDNF